MHMNRNLKNVALVIIITGVFIVVRFVATTIHYGCHREMLVNVDGGDDCPPPFWAVGQLGFYATGGSFNPLWNRDTSTVRKVSWIIENSDFKISEQKIAADVTTYDGKTTRYDLGTARGCTSDTKSRLESGAIVIGRVTCTFAESDTTFVASGPHGNFRIERYDVSAKDGSIATTTLVQIK